MSSMRLPRSIVPGLAGALYAAGTLLLPVVAPAATADPLAALRWTSRVLLVSAPAEGDVALARQRQVFEAMAAGARERDLVLVEGVGGAGRARALRSAFGLDPARFAALLVGKDGGVKLRSAGVLGPDSLFPAIDAMPMRRREMRRR